MKFFALLSIAVVLGFLAFCTEHRIPVSVEEVNTSPAMYADAHPGEYAKEASFLYQSDSPKWGRTYRYLIVSKGEFKFEGKDYLKVYPEDAVEIFAKPDGNALMIFSDKLPDKQLFVW